MKTQFLFLLLLIVSQSAWSQKTDLHSNLKKSITRLNELNKNPAECADDIDRSVKKTTVKDPNGKDIEVSSVSMEYLQELFAAMAKRSEIPFKYPEDGCYARAHAMSILLEQQGVITGKTFIEGSLRVETENSPKGYVEWWYHVAPIIVGRDKDGKEQTFVIDPSIFNHAVPAEEWYNIQIKHNPSQTCYKYCTPRYAYQPGDQGRELTAYRKEDLNNYKQTMAEYMIVQNEREKAKRGEKTELPTLPENKE